MAHVLGLVYMWVFLYRILVSVGIITSYLFGAPKQSVDTHAHVAGCPLPKIQHGVLDILCTIIGNISSDSSSTDLPSAGCSVLSRVSY
jgi:hypothetical protein